MRVEFLLQDRKGLVVTADVLIGAVFRAPAGDPRTVFVHLDPLDNEALLPPPVLLALAPALGMRFRVALDDAGRKRPAPRQLGRAVGYDEFRFAVLVIQGMGLLQGN
jgi:hypothetical protein